MRLPPYSLTDIMTEMSYKIGELTVPTNGVEDRKQFIQDALGEAHDYADWDWAKATVTLPIAAGIISLPTTVQLTETLDLRIKASGLGDDKIFTQIPYEEQDSYGQGDYRYWLTGDVGSYVANTTETQDSVSVITTRYDELPADLLGGASTKFPSAKVLAQGALRDYRAARDPDYDVSQDQALFEKGLEDLAGKQRRLAGPRHAKVRSDLGGARPGEIG